MNASGHLRPGSVPWNYAYPPAGPTRPPTGDHYTDPYAQRTVDSSLPSIPPPFRGPHDGYDAGFGRDGVEYTSSLSPVESSRPHLPGLDHRTRRTSLEGGSSMRKAAMPTSRLGLDPVAKQERRREQNRLAQRAFRARAKMREQGKVCQLVRLAGLLNGMCIDLGFVTDRSEQRGGRVSAHVPDQMCLSGAHDKVCLLVACTGLRLYLTSI